MDLSLHSFIHSLPFIHSFIHFHSFIHSFPFIHFHSSITNHSFIHSFIHCHSFIHSSIAIHSFIHCHSFTHSLTPALCGCRQLPCHLSARFPPGLVGTQLLTLSHGAVGGLLFADDQVVVARVSAGHLHPPTEAATRHVGRRLVNLLVQPKVVSAAGTDTERSHELYRRHRKRTGDTNHAGPKDTLCE